MLFQSKFLSLLAISTLAIHAAAQCPTLPQTVNMPTVTSLNDPFTRVDGSRVTTAADWTCRRDELSQLFQRYELGTKPPKPSSVTASFASNTLTVNVAEAGKSISFTAKITYPSSGQAPYPAIIAFGGGSLPVPAGVAMINFNQDDIAAQQSGSSRGQGKFYTLYGSNHSAGAMMAWAWGVSRVIDSLEVTSAARIDVKRLGVTGCSRNGKGALVAGAFDDRIALTIAQESGSGGDACWRISDSMLQSGTNTQTASEIVQENVWFSTNFNTFANRVTTLPFDHHELAGLVAPRGLLSIENTGIDWLGPQSSFGCMTGAQKIYQALGKSDAMGFTQVGNHNHCQFPSSQQGDLDAFVGKYLFGKSTNTNIFKSDKSFNLDQNRWYPWSVPTLQ